MIVEVGSKTPRDVFLAAVKLPPDQWQSFLDMACGGDDLLQNRVQELLDAHQMAGSFLQPAVERQLTAQFEPNAEGPGTVIGPYKLLEQIGEGGMGVVFMAEQTRPVRRRVALKIIKPGMDTRQVVARFEAERQALAMMDHPNIARVLDAGATDTGRPYFVMELVRGVPMTEFCNQKNLSIRERLELFVTVCQAVQHAHQKGIIHRDIKPTNVLVTLHDGRPVIKVIDFGVAKATGQKLTDKTLFTGFTQMIGTPLYMSPEQAEMSGLDVDTRSDIFSCGVLLYELLTGSTPFDSQRLKSASFDELRRIIREEEPPRPSTRLTTLVAEAASTVGTQRKTDPRQLSRLFRGELDWIVMKCLEKDRTRRYETASALAGDVERYLHDDPVQACPPSARYRFGKFARRNKWAFIGTGLFATTLLAIVGVVAASIGWVVRDHAARLTVFNQQIAQALDETKTWYQSGKLFEAMSAVKRTEGLLATRGDGDELERLVSQWHTDLQMVKRLDQLRLDPAAISAEVAAWRLSHTTETDPAWRSAVDRAYQDEFHRHGLDFETLDVGAAAQRIHNSPIMQALVAALDDWFQVTQYRQSKDEKFLSGKTELLQIARLADPDPWRDRLRDAIQRDDEATLVKLAAEKEVVTQTAATVLHLARALGRQGQVAQALRILRQTQQQQPSDFWINSELAARLITVNGEDMPDESVGFQRTAVALRPDCAGAYLALGTLLHWQRKNAEAGAAFREAINLQPKYSDAYHNFFVMLDNQEKYTEAEALGREYIHAMPDNAEAHSDLATSLAERAESANDPLPLDESVAEFVRAVELSSDTDPGWGSPRKAVCRELAIWDEVFSRVAQRLPNEPTVWIGRGQYHLLRNQWAEAKADFAKVIHARPIYNEESFEYAGLLLLSNETDEYQQFCNAMAARSDQLRGPVDAFVLARICALSPASAVAPSRAIAWATEGNLGYAWSSHVLGFAYYRAGQYDMAIANCLKSIASDWDGSWGLSNAQNFCVLAMAHHRLGNNKKAQRM